MFLDRIRLTFKAGNGGDGSVHFARIKYNPFAGPDGGDGGDGGSAVLVADRNVDTLYQLRTANTTAQNGAPGAGNLMIGATAPDLEIRVPVGTVVTDAATDEDLAELTASGQRFIVAQGGAGGKGNPKYATGRRRTPRLAEPGEAGEERDAVLTFRLYADTVLLEADGPVEWKLLPRLIGRAPELIDWELYQRRPRWLRVDHDFRLYDVGYIPLDLEWPEASEEPHLAGSLLEHVYWARHVFINLAPSDLVDATIAAAFLDKLQRLPLRRLERITLALPPAVTLDAYNVVQVAAEAPAALLDAFLQQLTGDVVA
jgi:hypothetical protein